MLLFACRSVDVRHVFAVHKDGFHKSGLPSAKGLNAVMRSEVITSVYRARRVGYNGAYLKRTDKNTPSTIHSELVSCQKGSQSLAVT